MRQIKDVYVKASDGIRLATDVFLPDNHKKYPVIHVRCPYVKDQLEAIEFANNVDPVDKTFSIQRFVDNGYAFVVQDCRGTGKSEGAYKPWLKDAEDGAELVDWIYQQEWCNGKIGALGPSNYGSVQLLTASMNPKHLTCIVPMGTDAAMPFFHDGVLSLAGSVIWYIQQAYNSAKRNGMPDEQYQIMDQKFQNILKDLNTQYRWLPLKDVPFANIKEVDMQLFFHEFLEHLDDPAHWTAIHNPADVLNIHVPMLLITDWYDHLAPRMFELYEALKRHGTPEVQKNIRLYIGPWRKYAGIEGSELGLWDNGRTFFDIVIDWFDYWLKGIDNGIMDRPPVFLHTLGNVSWKYYDQWPPRNSHKTHLFIDSNTGANSLNGDGRLVFSRDHISGEDHFIYDPMNPVESRTGIVIHKGDQLRQDQRIVESRDDVLVYSTDILSSNMEIIGPVTAHIWASTTAVDTDFTVKLVNVLEDESTYALCEGIVRGHVRNGLDYEEPLIPGVIYEFIVSLGATGISLAKGHRLRIEISSSNFPKFDRNMNTGNPVGEDTFGISAYQTIYHDLQHPSYLEIYIMDEV